MEIEVVDVHYELEYRFDEGQPWTRELSHIEWNDPEAADEWANEHRPDVQHRIVKVQRTPLDLVVDDTDVIEENERMRTMLAGLGFCPKDGESMPCTTCGAGL